MNLVVKGRERFLGTEIPVIEGGFGENNRCILVRDIARVFETEQKRINEVIKNNMNEFEIGVDLLEIQSVIKSDRDLCEKLGYNHGSLYKSKGVYLLSESGYLTLCMIMKGNKYARNIRKKLKKEYFAMKEIIISQSEYIALLEEKNKLLEQNLKLMQRNNELNEKLNTACKIPKTQLIKDIKIFLNSNTKKSLYGKVDRDTLFKSYLYNRRTRLEQPTMSQFEDIVYNLGIFNNGDSWLDIVIK